MPHRMPIAVLISGRGRTLVNLLKLQTQGDLDVDIRCVVSSSHRAGGNQIATAAGIPLSVVPRTRDQSPEAFRDAVFAPCFEHNVELVVMGGFLKHVLIPPEFHHRVINIHPSLIPAYAGKGYYGMRVHQAVLKGQEQVTGCTVHYVDDQYDHGPIILQRIIAIHAGESPESLAARVFQEECLALPDAIRVHIHRCRDSAPSSEDDRDT